MAGLEFCHRCGKLVEIKIINGKQTGVCICGFTKTINKISSVEKIKKAKEKGKGIVSDSNKNAETIHNICKKCGYDKAEVVDLGAQVADEANIYLFKCAKCKFVERQSDGSCNL